MDGYFKVPAYLDAACTQFYKYLYIIYISKERLDSMNGLTYWYQRPNGQRSSVYANIGNVGSNIIGISCVAYPRNDSYGSTNGVSILSQLQGSNFVRARLNAEITSNCGNIYNSVKDKFNIFHFFEGNVTKVYFKTGGSITLVNNGNGRYGWRCEGSRVSTGVDNFFIGSTVEYLAGDTTQETRSTLNYSEAIVAAQAGLPYFADFGAYGILYTTVKTGINAQYQTDHFAAYGRLYYADRDDRYGILPATTTCIQIRGYSNTSILYALFGYNEMISVAEAEYVDYTEDIENTYPGGGDDKNPYPDEGSESPGGESGKGDFDNTNDEVDFPTLPTFDVQSTGFISLWNPTITQLTDLYTFLWDSDISTTLKKLFNEPMNAIFSLGIIPVDPVTQGTRRLTIGHVDTEIDMESIQKQFVTFDFGSIDINEYYGAAWDYSPYTHASIYLPYIGVQSVDIDDIMNCTLTLRYNIDVLTGTTIALLKCVRKGRDNLNAVMYEWQGNCVTQCPITAGNWSQIMASVIQLGAMTGLALSQPVVGAIGSAVGSSAAAEYAQGKNLVNPTMATYGALNVLGSKVHVQRGGRLDMSSGAMSMQKAFVILNRPVSGIPRGWNKYAGYPSLKIKTLGSQEGFVSVGAIKLDGLRATAEEINELDTILKTGVII